MHLVGVFPPELKAREQRERYIEKLRMVYDSLKGEAKVFVYMRCAYI